MYVVFSFCEPEIADSKQVYLCSRNTSDYTPSISTVEADTVFQSKCKSRRFQMSAEMAVSKAVKL